MIGKCKQRSVVYETTCVLCDEKRKKEEEKRKELEKDNKKKKEKEEEETIGKKRKRRDIRGEKENEEIEFKRTQKVKYIGETSKSGYERLKQHLKDFKNFSKKSHMMKHYLDYHREEKMEKIEFKFRVIKRYRSVF